MVGDSRGLEQSAEAERVHESGKRRRIGAVTLEQPQEADHRIRGAADIDLELRVEAVRQRQRRVERQRTLERRFSLTRARSRSARADVYFAITRWQRASRAHAGAKSGASSTHA